MKTKQRKARVSLAKNASRNVYDVAIAGVIEQAKVHGFTTRLAEKMGRIANAKFHRQHVELWLNPDPKRRTEPRYGAGMLMIHAANLIANEDSQRVGCIPSGMQKP